MPTQRNVLLTSLLRSLAGSCAEPCWRPAADVYRLRQGWAVKFDLAGVRPDEIVVETRGRFLIVRGERRDCCVEEGQHHQLMEIAYSRFERAIELSEDLANAELATEYQAGMLLVRIQTRGEERR
jgi:HSP20 family protein